MGQGDNEAPDQRCKKLGFHPERVGATLGGFKPRNGNKEKCDLTSVFNGVLQVWGREQGEGKN